jgi:hypothetical protein
MTTWRYQAVSRSIGNETVFSFVEVYLDDDGQLETWTENAEIAPVGDTATDLIETLHKMESNARRWGVVEYSALSVGFAFEAKDGAGADLTMGNSHSERITRISFTSSPTRL